MNVTRTICAALAALVLLSGCETTPKSIQPPYTVYRSPSLLEAAPRRVLLMPVVSSTFDDGHAKLWYETLAGELRATKRFDVVTTSPEVPCVQECLDWVERGQFSERNLAAVRDYYRVDGVMFVKQADYYPYTPPRMSVALSLVNVATGETVAAVDGTWNADDRCVEQLMRKYAKNATLASRYGNPSLVEISPRQFGRFVAHELSDSISRLMQPPVHHSDPTASLAGAEECIGDPLTASPISTQHFTAPEPLPAPAPIPAVAQPPAPVIQPNAASAPQHDGDDNGALRPVRIGGARTYGSRHR